MLFPSTCDVIRNLSGIWQILFPKKPVRFIDLPQNFAKKLGGDFYQHDLKELIDLVVANGGTQPTKEAMARSIRLYNENRNAISALYDLRSEQPQLVASDECFLVVKAGAVLDVAEHTQLVHDFIAQAKTRKKKKEDRIRVVMIGAFCEQPPIGLLRSLDRSGCYVVDDDLNLGMRWLEADVEPGNDPLEAFSNAYLTQSTWASTKYEADDHRAPKLLALVKKRKADGVVFAAPSFCDPALLDQPVLQKILSVSGVPHIAFKYAENTGQFQGIREQAGTFSDSIKLWGAA
jgi:benzoyl-CoA reductase subunit C